MKNKGFSLVELIVVIAIMAILVGVAVPVYSSYIEKTQKTTDMQLVDEVAHALTIYAINNPNQIGYVMLTPEKVDCQANELGDAAMKATFGDNWKEDLFLRYDGWVDAFGGADSFAANADIQEILDSSVSLLTDLATTVIDVNEGNSNVNGIIATMLSDPGSERAAEIEAELAKYKNDPNYSTIASNLVVKYVSEELKDATIAFDEETGAFLGIDGANSPTAQIAALYAIMYSMSAETDENGAQTPSAALAQKQLDTFNEGLADLVEQEQADTTTSVVNSALELLTAAVGDAAFENYFLNYVETNGTDDWTGLSAMLGLVDSFAGNYLDKDSLANKDLFKKPELLDLTNIYQRAAALGGVVVMITADGTIVYLPTAIAPEK